ncbi:MAG TPA: TetR/AcrR family transcriptional regulator [Chitinophagaceae bacterium]
MPKIVRRKASKKEMILNKAAQMFREKGFSATSMRDLAETVGIEAASLYNHIHSKSQILQEIVFRAANDCNVHLAQLNIEKGACLDDIESIIRFHVQMMINRFEDYHVMTHEWMHLSEPFLSDFIHQRRTYVQKLEAIVEDCIQRKEIKPIIPYVAVLNILSAVRGLEFWHRSQKKYTPEELEENMVMHLISGLKK